MKAAWYEKQGPAREVLRVGEMTAPIPGPGEVRIRMVVSGINPGDVKKRQDSLGYGMSYPRVIPHSDGAGYVDQVGDGELLMNGWSSQCGATGLNRIVLLVRQPNFPWFLWSKRFDCPKACQWSRALVWASPA